MKIRFLLDENMSPDIAVALHRYSSAIDIRRVGDDGAPPLATLDPDILRYCEVEQRALVTDNRSSMPAHIADHWRAGGHHWGIFTTRRKEIPLGELASQLILMWEASDAEEYLD